MLAAILTAAISGEDGNDFRKIIDCFASVKSMPLDDKTLTIRGLCRPHSIFEYPRPGELDWLEIPQFSAHPLVR